MEQSHRCYKVIMSLPAEPPSTVEPRMIWESRYNKRSSSLKYPTYITFGHDCVEASSQDTPEWKFPSFCCHLGFSFRVKIIKICHHVAIWMREIESCLGMKMKWRKFSHQLNPLRGVHIISWIVATYGGVHEIPKWTVAERHKYQRKRVLLRLSTLNYLVFPHFAAVTAEQHFRGAPMFSQICPLSFQICSVGWRRALWGGGERGSVHHFQGSSRFHLHR